jgi:phosphatidylinositol alpha-1,6-mannosyltransferase
LRYVLRHASVAICAGTYPESEARRVAAEWMPPVVQVPPGVDTDRFAPLDLSRRDEVRQRLGLDPGALLVSSYSRLVPRKGMHSLIRASASLSGRYPRLQVAIGGAGRDRARLEKLARRLNAPVVFLGRVHDQDLAPWLGASDLMVMACRSRWAGLEQEGFGIVFVEAGATGLAQIAGRSGGSHEAVRHGVTGLVVERPTHDDALADAMAHLLDDDELRSEFARSARELARSDFDWRVLAARLGSGLAPYDNGSGRRPV